MEALRRESAAQPVALPTMPSMAAGAPGKALIGPAMKPTSAPHSASTTPLVAPAIAPMAPPNCLARSRTSMQDDRHLGQRGVISMERWFLFCVAPARSITHLVTRHGKLMLSQEFVGMCSEAMLYSESGQLPTAVYSTLRD